ncbi:hypothetical protein GQ55_1G090900 [Panicum hallii var. hallii]|uniref:Uncharacterized protein n=1 Tax=Panicum hallii var. hallii TaxID=1504633 RepID=A0A2T7F3U7_9POAL|nr:hypothetical protein GQ55_1G090900 [Panicum hallii var. hallii]PUZ74757.1 hypothetical protein GQ55_1G090900 [Panicum hallii var. hallii]PUZ74759.1 hypothetical protein GQ55_1G090900 [Panicum hallii var. hallii]
MAAFFFVLPDLRSSLLPRRLSRACRQRLMTCLPAPPLSTDERVSFLVNCYALGMSRQPPISGSLESFGFDGAGSVIYTHLVVGKEVHMTPIHILSCCSTPYGASPNLSIFHCCQLLWKRETSYMEDLWT